MVAAKVMVAASTVSNCEVSAMPVAASASLKSYTTGRSAILGYDGVDEWHISVVVFHILVVSPTLWRSAKVWSTINEKYVFAHDNKSVTCQAML